MNTNRFIGSMLLISGTAIGAAMLALPVITGIYGFFSACILFIGVWIFTTYAALLLLEVNLWFSSDTNIISMAKKTLGTPGQMAAWVLSVLFLYTLMVAYISGLGEMLNDTVKVNFSLNIPIWFYASLVAILFAIFICRGKRTVDYVNRIFIIGIVIFYVVLMVTVMPEVNTNQVFSTGLHSPLAALPVALAAFGYTVVVPSIRNYLGDDPKQLKLAIIVGGAIPLLIYILWEFVVLGVIPIEGSHSLMAIIEHGDPGTGITTALNQILLNPYIVIATRFFVFFAIASSFTGVSMGLFDILADGLQIPKTASGKVIIALLTFFPPLVVSLLFQKVFIVAIGYAGVLNVLLFFVMPALMVWRGRSSIDIASPLYQVTGGRVAQSLVLVFSSIVIIMEMAIIAHWV